jgi:hypothetical protein
VQVSTSVLESEFVEYLQTLRPDEETLSEFPGIASKVWAERHVDTTAMIKKLKASLEEQKQMKAKLLRAKLRGEVSQADYVQGNSDFDNEIDTITEQLRNKHSQQGTLDTFLRFANLMLVDISAAWQQAGIEQRLCVQNFLFRDGILYEKTQKFLNTTNPTLFQQLRELAHCKEVVGVPRPTFLVPSSSRPRRHTPSSRASIGSRRRDRSAVRRQEAPGGQNSRKRRFRFERMHRGRKPAT